MCGQGWGKFGWGASKQNIALAYEFSFLVLDFGVQAVGSCRATKISGGGDCE